MKAATRRQLIGRTIVNVEMRPFPKGDGRTGVTYDPVLTLDNGRRLYFKVEETENGIQIYGIRPFLTPARRRQWKRYFQPEESRP